MIASIPLILVAVLAVLVALVLVLFALWYWEHRRLSRMLAGKSGADLEDTINEVARAVRVLVSKQQDHERQTAQIREQLGGAIQHIGIVRFNPFRDAGGDQSFAVALMDESKNGVVISSLYARDGVRVYAKPLEEGASSYKLSEEEERAITLALA